MRSIKAADIIEAVASLCIHANRYLPQDVQDAFTLYSAKETTAAAKEVFRQLEENYRLAAQSGLPLCQDTGAAVFLVRLGQDVHIEGMPLTEAINEGVRKGYKEGLLRNSMCHPFTRKNTGDNTPATIHYEMVPGDELCIAYMGKGGGSENMSRATMLAPSQGWEGIKKFVVQRVAEAGPNPCPPIIVGVGIGGTFDYAPVLAKHALMRPIGDLHPDADIAAKEKELLEAINKLGIGPMGLGGATTALDVKIAIAPCHIATLPLAVNIQCHSSRHGEVRL